MTTPNRRGPLTEDDPRHGTNAGYLAHRRYGEDPCDVCRRGRTRDRKRYALAGLYSPHLHDSDDVATVIDPWLALGIGRTAILKAAGLGNGANQQLRDGHPVRRNTYRALAALTEKSFPGRTRVWADLTRTRIYSLMAAGHQLQHMPINPGGRWRDSDQVFIETAATIRAYYAAHQARDGDCDNTRVKALRAGHQPPVTWDDPATLAWPLDAIEPVSFDPIVDWAAVARVVDGDATVPTTYAERVAVTAEWLRRGRPLAALERATGWKADRYTADARAQLDDAGEVSAA